MNLVRGWAATLVAAVAAILCSPHALADGKVFRQATAVVPMVDQEAVIAFKDGVEVLAVRTRADAAAAKGEPLAWVVPLPAVPELFTTTPGVFDTARALTQPRLLLHSEPGPGWLAFFVALFVLAVGVSLRAVSKAPAVGRTMVGVLWIVIAFVLMVMIFMPSLAKSRSMDSVIGGSGVEVLKRERVGTLEVAVVRASDGADSAKALVQWLKDAGCQVPPSADAALADYAARGWVFVAASLAQPTGGERLEPTPLVARFDTQAPVYPMKLTGVGNGPLSLDLCVIADGTADAPGMRVARSSPLYAKGAAYIPDGVPLVHEGLLGLVDRLGGPGGATARPAWITRLTGTLSPRQQAADMQLNINGSGERIGEKIHTFAGAVGLGAECGAGVCAAGFLVLTVLCGLGRLTLVRTVKWSGACLLAGCAVCVVVAVAVPKFDGEVRLGRRHERLLSNLPYNLKKEAPPGLEGARRFIADKRAAKVEAYAGLPPEGDVPSGYTLRCDDNGDLWVDLYNRGGEVSDRYLVRELRK